VLTRRRLPDPRLPEGRPGSTHQEQTVHGYCRIEPAGPALSGPAQSGTVALVRPVITSDTHVPARARDLPAKLWLAIEVADVVVHAGDWVSEDLLDTMLARAARLIGVYGNNDGPALRARLPEVVRVDLAGLSMAVVHETGPATGREHRCERRFPDCDLLVFGHSHIPWDSLTPGGLRLLNPGSPTDRRRQPYATYLTTGLSGGRLTDVTLHRLPPRSAGTPTGHDAR
jgi:hypothetical protein